MRDDKATPGIAELRREALSKGRFAESRSLGGFGMDADYALEQTGNFVKIRCKKTGDPRRAIIISCRPSSANLRTSHLRRSLKEVWEQDLDYGGQPSGYEFGEEQGKLLFEFVTSSEFSDLVVSGAIEVTGIEELQQ
jgi:hypothetical protein